MLYLLVTIQYILVIIIYLTIASIAVLNSTQFGRLPVVIFAWFCGTQRFLGVIVKVLPVWNFNFMLVTLWNLFGNKSKLKIELSVWIYFTKLKIMMLKIRDDSNSLTTQCKVKNAQNY